MAPYTMAQALLLRGACCEIIQGAALQRTRLAWGSVRSPELS
ncbi:unnamed protein product [Linum tenue]|uniref:Uncharacterized protein n=1 Tax=Linum tenue TaxID=586396 RepID=A0AAV0J2T0_9ROSI|nr:unnamed protein product [Linum tenue]CAI0466275.1 unnamed protein product [Linum tenue]